MVQTCYYKLLFILSYLDALGLISYEPRTSSKAPTLTTYIDLRSCIDLSLEYAGGTHDDEMGIGRQQVVSTI